jgi:spore germination cell wall hydrolase CwlJ-like protein
MDVLALSAARQSAYRRRVPRKRPQSRPRRTATRARGPGSDGWLLLLGLVTAIILAVSLFGPRMSQRPPPAALKPMSAAAARRSNAAVPIDARPRARAAPFRFSGGAAAWAQAVDCLATAAIYEVGRDRRGQRAVMQVILNRARSPGYPRTICGVVYQGYARASGCQFSFTCDGSFGRRPVHDGWDQARSAARRALAGHVDQEVGRATHYHADWVVPYWRDTLTKIARVGPHLFYLRCPAPSRARVC